jgi:hypothetical protein
LLVLKLFSAGEKMKYFFLTQRQKPMESFNMHLVTIDPTAVYQPLELS